MTHILAVSDWRSQPIDDLYTILETVEPTPDLLLYAGDDLSRFKNADTDTDHLAELARLTKHQQSLYVRGNDDLPRQPARSSMRNLPPTSTGHHTPTRISCSSARKDRPRDRVSSPTPRTTSSDTFPNNAPLVKTELRFLSLTPSLRHSRYRKAIRATTYRVEGRQELHRRHPAPSHRLRSLPSIRRQS